MSDCGAIRDFYQKDCHAVSETPVIAAGKAIMSGTDLECGSVYKNIPQAIANGELTMEKIDESLMRLLTARIRLGDFDDDNTVEWTSIPEDRLCSKQHNQLAYEMAQKSMVLLQNRDNLLPLRKTAHQGPDLQGGLSACHHCRRRGNPHPLLCGRCHYQWLQE